MFLDSGIDVKEGVDLWIYEVCRIRILYENRPHVVNSWSWCKLRCDPNGDKNGKKEFCMSGFIDKLDNQYYLQSKN